MIDIFSDIPCKVFNCCTCRSRVTHQWKSSKHITNNINNCSTALFFKTLVEHWKLQKYCIVQWRLKMPTKIISISHIFIMSFLPIPSFDIRNVPVKFVSITAFHPFRGISLAREGNWPPPLLIKKSILSWSLIIEATVFLKFQITIMDFVISWCQIH